MADNKEKCFTNKKTVPLISIVTVCRNSEKTLRRTIESVLNQEYPALEYILVDGASTDKTVAIIREYERKIQKWISEPDQGISDAFNKGISMASGEIIGIINSDDILLPGALQAVADAYDPVIDVYRGKMIIRDESNNTQVLEEPSLVFDLTDTNHICHPATFITKKAYEKFGVYDVSCRFVMDYDLLLRLQEGRARFQKVDKPLAVFTLAGITAANDYAPKRLQETERVLRRHGATEWNIFQMYFIKRLKKVVKRVVKKKTLLKIVHKKAPLAEGNDILTFGRDMV